MSRGRALGTLLLLLALCPSARAASVTTKEIEEALTCQCGCGLTVHSCNHLQCGSGIPLRQEVLTLVTQGLSRDEILIRFREKYGEKILSSPTTEGFNLTAWILPFVVVAAGAGLLVRTVRRWTAAERGEAASPAPVAVSESDRRRLDAELAKEPS
ncbi:MAG: cytochrome c-type biogenesis protein CcmH [Deltaproteobacteria bacterium]|nr:cytochrome c-type biogenesis protein CcmH [Deltaproteobacteria bacterium]